MRWKIMHTSATTNTTLVWSLGYPTRKAAATAARRLNSKSPSYFFVERMTPEDEALASKLEAIQ